MSAILDFIKTNWGIIFSGCGVTLLVLISTGLIKYLRSHKIIKKDEYSELLKYTDRYECIKKLKDGLEFDQDFGIYIDKKTSEKYCPHCLTNKITLNHLDEIPTDFGTTYSCGICPYIFRNKSFYQRQKANQDELAEFIANFYNE